MEFIKIKNFYLSMDTVKEIKREITDKSKVFTKHISNRGEQRTSNLNKEFLQLKNKR